MKYQFKSLSFPMFVLKLFIFIVIINLFTFVLAKYEGIPYVLIILFVLIIGYTFVMNKMVIGRHGNVSLVGHRQAFYSWFLGLRKHTHRGSMSSYAA
ncbi:hypothetical protein P5G51_004540 [Virgibacillus sp. 179-BFC.A HS]|uniref:Uncharacterized protein n=1 Tax=Tigheibacillus jepli TaxID=3035914 RepID=A0ABU5CEK6_9BACI|nr:hypothetical protein [Virgibacillus sp. 179-BFC.A HS]MDY0404766.1 hypothetical protein [Virgibacillus sp. 179-BFC.A HS]